MNREAGTPPYEVTRGSRDDSCYRFSIHNKKSETRSPAYLTNELFPNATHERHLLLCNDTSVIQTRTEYTLFADLTNMLQAAPHQRLGLTKSVVNEIAEGHSYSESIRIAVHKFGPVPVLVLKEEVNLTVHGRSVHARIAMFPNNSQRHTRHGRESAYKPFFISSRNEFRKSMTIAPALVFRRYFEDVAEDFHDLRRTLRGPDVFRRAKMAETRLAESVTTKLHLLIPRVRLHRNDEPQRHEAWAIFMQNAGTLYEAAVARAQALFLLNEIYLLTGIAPRTKYSAEFDGIRQHFAMLLGPDVFGRINEQHPILRYLLEIQDMYESVDLLRQAYTVASELLRFASETPAPWCGEYAKLAAFTLIGRTLVGSKPTARVFISHHHDVPKSQTIREQISKALVTPRHRSVVPVAITRLPAGSPARHVVRSGIWLSQGTIAICPADVKSILTKAEKDYTWIAREGEYSLLLKKPVLFGTEQGCNLETVLADLENPQVGYLVTGSKLPPNETRAAELGRYFKDNVRAEFRVEPTKADPSVMDPSLAADVEHFANDVRFVHARLLLDGYVSQFDEEARRLLIITLVELGPLGKSARAEIVGKIAQKFANRNKARTNMAFTNMWIQVRKRHLLVVGRDIGLLGLSKKRGAMNHKYGERLSLVIRLLLPELDSSERKTWRLAWLREQLKKLGVPSPED